MASMNIVASWLTIVSSRFSFWTSIPIGSTPTIATSANPITARLIAISIMVNPRTDFWARARRERRVEAVAVLIAPPPAVLCEPFL
jgi:hypothetical protein